MFFLFGCKADLPQDTLSLQDKRQIELSICKTLNNIQNVPEEISYLFKSDVSVNIDVKDGKIFPLIYPAIRGFLVPTKDEGDYDFVFIGRILPQSSEHLKDFWTACGLEVLYYRINAFIDQWNAQHKMREKTWRAQLPLHRIKRIYISFQENLPVCYVKGPDDPLYNEVWSQIEEESENAQVGDEIKIPKASLTAGNINSKEGKELMSRLRYELKMRIKPLIKDLQNYYNPSIRARAAWELGEIGDKRAKGALKKLLNDNDNGVRNDVKQALEKLKKKKRK